MVKILIISSLLGFILSILNLAFDSLPKQRSDLGGIVIASVLALMSLIFSIQQNLFSRGWASGIGLTIVFWGVLGILFGLARGTYTFGSEKGKKYWRNHVEKFYAYGIGFFIVAGLALYLIIGNSIGSGSEMESYNRDYDSGLKLNEMLYFSLALSLTLIFPYWTGVFTQSRRQNLENREKNCNVK